MPFLHFQKLKAVPRSNGVELVAYNLLLYDEEDKLIVNDCLCDPENNLQDLEKILIFFCVRGDFELDYLILLLFTKIHTVHV